MAGLSDVAGIIDMDGFMVNGKFYCKELGLFKIGEAMARPIFFYTGLRWLDLSEKDKRTCKHVMKYIHRLPFGTPRGVKAVGILALEGIIMDFYQMVKQNGNSVLGYKGGHYEKDLLASLAIPSINLENFGCPKAGELICDLVWLEACGNHTVPDAFAHCPKVEVEAYGHWLEKTMNIIY